LNAWIPLGKPPGARGIGFGQGAMVRCDACGGWVHAHAGVCPVEVAGVARYMVAAQPTILRLLPAAPAPRRQALDTAAAYPEDSVLRRHWLAVAERIGDVMGEAATADDAPAPLRSDDYRPPPPSERAKAAAAVQRFIAKKIMTTAVVQRHPGGRYRTVKFERAGKLRPVKGAVYVYSPSYVKVWFNSREWPGVDTLVYETVEEALTFLDLAFCVGDAEAARSVPTRRPRRAAEEGATGDDAHGLRGG
jgi:hypothetical protein